MRPLLFVLLVAAVFGSAACGDDDSSKPAAGEDRLAPAVTGPTGATAEGTTDGGAKQKENAAEDTGSTRSGSRSRTRRNRSQSERERLRSRRPTRRGDFTGTARTVYYESRARCLTIPLRSLARAYGARSEQPQDVAAAYAARQAPSSDVRQAALQGCLDGINTRIRRGE
jgi:hypothetical protein